MNDRVFSIVVLMGLLCLAMSLQACGNRNIAVAGQPTATVNQVEPEARFASLDTLADFMTQDVLDNGTLEKLVSRYESQTAAIASYWALSGKEGDPNDMANTVFKDLTALADSLSGFSTMDMVQSGEITCAMEHYLTARDYCRNYSKKPLYQAEMRDWLQLEDTLRFFYGELGYLTYWGGSIARIIASGSMAFLAETRHNDYSQLKKGGSFANSELPTIAEALTTLTEELAAAKSLEDDMNADDHYYREMLKEMRGHADMVVQLIDKWLTSRKRLCEAEGIPEAHTAHLITLLSGHITDIIEQ